MKKRMLLRVLSGTFDFKRYNVIVVFLLGNFNKYFLKQKHCNQVTNLAKKDVHEQGVFFSRILS